MADPMTDDEVRAGLAEFPSWEASDKSIHAEFRFSDHIEAMGFVNRVALAAEKLDHHPDLRIVYNRVEIVLSSHDAGGVTARDFRLARAIERYR